MGHTLSKEENETTKMQPHEIQKNLKLVTQIGWASTFLLIVKLVFAFYFGSKALVGDAIYSVKDIVCSAVSVLSIKFYSKSIDGHYPYGRGKVVYITGLLTGFLILAAAVALFVYSMNGILAGQHKQISFLAMIAIVASILVTSYFYKKIQKQLKTSYEPTLDTLGHHLHLDMVTSYMVGLGIIVSATFGIHFLDAIIAIFEAVHLSHSAAHMIMDGYGNLMDKNLPPEDIERIKRIITTEQTSLKLRRVQGRMSGRQIILDLDVSFAPDQTIAQTTAIIAKLKQGLRENLLDASIIQVVSIPEAKKG